NGSFKQREFSMGKNNDIIVGEKISESEQRKSGTIVNLRILKNGKSIDKKLITIARNLVEKLLPYFIAKDYDCPKIILSEKDGKDAITLNKFFSNELASVIQEIHVEDGTFTQKGIESDEVFHVRVFKLYYPKSQKSKISLVAHKREVS